MTTANPGDTWESMARVGYEMETEETILQGVVSGPLSDTLGIRLAVRAADMSGGIMNNQGYAQTMNATDIGDGFALRTYDAPQPDSDTPQTERLAARLTLAYDPTDNLSVKLKGYVNSSESNSGSWASEMWRCESGTSQLSPGIECNGNWANYDQDMPAELVKDNPLMSKHNGRLYEESDSAHFTAIVHYDADNYAIDWVSGWQDFDSQLMPKGDVTDIMNRGTFSATDTTYEAGSTELRFTSTFDSPINFMGGVYYQTSELNFQQDILFPGSLAGGPLVDSSATDPTTRSLTVRKLGSTDGKTFAAFGQIMWDITSELELSAGGRYTRESKDSIYSQPYVISLFRAVFRQEDPANPMSKFNEEQNWNDFSPEVMLTWKPSDELMFFAGFKTGYKSGGFSISGLNSSGTVAGDLMFEPEEAEGFEAGVKATLLDNQLRIGASVYTYEYDNLQVDFFDSTKTTFVTFNAGAAETRGIEFDGEWAPAAVPGLLVKGTLNFNDAYYSEFPGAPCYAGQTAAAGCLAPDAAFPRLHQDLKDVATALAPEWTASLGADYETTISNGLVLGLAGNLKFSDDYNLSPFGAPFATQDSYVTVDATVRLASEEGKWELALIGKNLTDEYILTYSQDAPSSGAGTGTDVGVHADQFGAPLMPRTALVQLTVNF